MSEWIGPTAFVYCVGMVFWAMLCGGGWAEHRDATVGWRYDERIKWAKRTLLTPVWLFTLLAWLIRAVVSMIVDVQQSHKGGRDE